VNFWGQWRLVYNVPISPILIGVSVPDVNNPPSWAMIAHAIWTAPLDVSSDCTADAIDGVAKLCTDVMCAQAFADNPDGISEFCNIGPAAGVSAAQAGYGGANPDEARWCAGHLYWCRRFQADASKALRLAERLFTGRISARRSDNTRSNAFQHSLLVEPSGFDCSPA